MLVKGSGGTVKAHFGYLYMPEEGVLSHIYDTHYGVQTKGSLGQRKRLGSLLRC